MAKVSRSVLKEIVKECLLEILFEGIDSHEPGYEDEEPIREARQPQRRASITPPKRDLAEAVNKSMVSNSKKQQVQKQSAPQKREVPNQRIDGAIGELTNDPLMASIFSDTARTTLQEQVEGRRPAIDNAASIVEDVEDISSIFEGAGNWASIAFGETE